MAPVPTTETTLNATIVSSKAKATTILHRTPWTPPIAASAEGMYITLDDGRRIIDAVGGAAVSCIGNGHPEVKQAIKDQVDSLSCECCGI